MPKVRHTSFIHTIATNTVWLLLLCGLIGVLGCTDREGSVITEMDAIRNSPAQPVKQTPTPQLVEDYVYNAMDVRSPFIPPSLLRLQTQSQDIQGVTPDLMRTKEPLERYELSQLTYRGMVTTPNGTEYGLIQRPDGLIESVKVGNYLGMNDGRIVEVTANQINLIEIVPDARAGFIEKPAALVSPL